jgi:hypothetical protein
VALHGHRHHHIDRPVGDLPVLDLDVDGIDEQDWIDALSSTLRSAEPRAHYTRRKAGGEAHTAALRNLFNKPLAVSTTACKPAPSTTPTGPYQPTNRSRPESPLDEQRREMFHPLSGLVSNDGVGHLASP